jgi:hypothetical protein
MLDVMSLKVDAGSNFIQEKDFHREIIKSNFFDKHPVTGYTLPRDALCRGRYFGVEYSLLLKGEINQ